jgi:hypothetical protein
MRSSSRDVGRSFQTRTCPSRPPVATRWYERPHDGAQEIEVIAYAVASSETDPESKGGEGSSERRVIGRREGES